MMKNKSNLIIRLFVLLLIMVLFFIPTTVNADTTQNPQSGVKTGIIDPGNFEPPDLTDDDTEIVTSKISPIVTIIRTIGFIVLIVTIILIGLRFMLGSIEEKADYKKSMIPFLIGAIIFFGLSQFLALIIEMANSIK